jgi:hypothetical protein
MIDVFAGRIYKRETPTAIQGFRSLLKRERYYEDQELYSIPVGSRYHPERAPIWVEDPEELDELAEELRI